LPDNLSWITLGKHPHRVLLKKEIIALEEELGKFELKKKQLKHARKELEKESKILKLIADATNQYVDKEFRIKIFLIIRPPPRIKEIEQEYEKEASFASFDQSMQSRKMSEDVYSVEASEHIKKKKYVILLKQCECCGLEVKRHNCKHNKCKKTMCKRMQAT